MPHNDEQREPVVAGAKHQFTRGKKKEPAKGPAGSSFRESSVAGGTCDAGSFKRITASSSQDGVNAAHAYEDSSSLSMAFEADEVARTGF
jgi:hypothetical protein